LILNAIGLVCTIWFGDDERGKATAIASLATPLGTLLSLMFTGVLTSCMTSEFSSVEQGVKNVLFVQGLIILSTVLPFMFLIKEEPEYPPSEAALVEPSTESMGK